MKKQSTFFRLAFFNLRALIGLCIALGGVFLGLLRLGAFSAKAQQNHNVTSRSMDPLVPAFFDCSKIHELGIDKQENMRAGAIMIACGLSEERYTVSWQWRLQVCPKTDGPRVIWRPGRGPDHGP